jgi:hypothetical protein
MLLEFLKAQGVLTVKQAIKQFLAHLKNPQRRIQHLIEANILECFTIHNLYKNKDDHLSKAYFPYLVELDIDQSTRIIQLSENYRQIMFFTKKLLKRNIIIHQLMLNEVRFYLENKVSFKYLLNDPKLTLLSEIHSDRVREFTPDLSFESDKYKIAIELERTIKSQRRYSDRFLYFTQSPYTHIIYYYTQEKTKKFLLKMSYYERRLGFSYFKNPGVVFSPAWGYMSLNEYIEAVKNIL